MIALRIWMYSYAHRFIDSPELCPNYMLSYNLAYIDEPKQQVDNTASAWLGRLATCTKIDWGEVIATDQ